MKTIGASLATHLASEVTTVAILWKVTRADAIVKAFTNHHDDIVYSGVTYGSAQGFFPTAIDTQSGANVDNLDVRGYLDALGVTHDDILNGKYDGCAVEILLVNYADLSMGAVTLRKGTLGEARFGRQGFETEVRGLIYRLQRELCEVYTPGCRADLGDARCQVNLATYTVTGSITTVVSSRVFHDSTRTEAVDYFNGGLLTWTSGSNTGLSMEVKRWTLTTKEIQLVLPMSSAVQVGDAYSMYGGCDKTLLGTNGCKVKFNNVVNFRGEPNVPQKAVASLPALSQGGGAKGNIK